MSEARAQEQQAQEDPLFFFVQLEQIDLRS
jgi:hypothetical protein